MLSNIITSHFHHRKTKMKFDDPNQFLNVDNIYANNTFYKVKRTIPYQMPN